MKPSEAIAALQVALFLLGTAWFDRAFDGCHVPPLAAEVHKPVADALSWDDGDQDPVNLTMPQASVPIGNRFVHAEPQNYHDTLQDDSWRMGTPLVMLQHMAARRMPVVYERANG
jgi:hypothetical protein